MRRGTRPGVLLVTAALLLGAGPAPAAPARFVRITAGLVGGHGPAITPDGKFVAFTAEPEPESGTLGPRSGLVHAYVHTVASGKNELASVSTAGKPADAHTTDVAISANGRYVAFTTQASNLAPKAQTTVPVFVRDRVARKTVAVHAVGVRPSASAGGVSSVAISDDGRYVAFSLMGWDLLAGNSGANTLAVGRVYRFDRSTRRIAAVSVGPDGKTALADQVGMVAISGDGRRVAFSSPDPLTPDDRDTGRRDVYVRDLVARRTTLLSGTLPDDADYGNPRLDQAGKVAAFLGTRTTGLTVEVTTTAGKSLRTVPSGADPAWTNGRAPALDPTGGVVGYVGTSVLSTITDAFSVKVGTGATQRLSESDQPACAVPGCGGTFHEVAVSRNAGVAVLVTTARLTADDLDNDVDAYVRT